MDSLGVEGGDGVLSVQWADDKVGEEELNLELCRGSIEEKIEGKLAGVLHCT